MFFKTADQKNSAIFTKNHLCWTLYNIFIVLESRFIKVALKFFIKKRLKHRYFPVNIAKFLRTDFATEARWLLSTWPCYILWMINELVACLALGKLPPRNITPTPTPTESLTLTQGRICWGQSSGEQFSGHLRSHYERVNNFYKIAVRTWPRSCAKVLAYAAYTGM